MISRRRFVGMLAVLPAITVLGGSVLRLDPRKSIAAPDMGKYFTSQDAWYLKTTPPEGMRYFYRNTLGTNVVLSERSLEAMLSELHAGNHAAYVVRPTKMIVSPEQYRAYMRAKDNERIRNWFERIWRRVMPA